MHPGNGRLCSTIFPRRTVVGTTVASLWLQLIIVFLLSRLASQAWQTSSLQPLHLNVNVCACVHIRKSQRQIYCRLVHHQIRRHLSSCFPPPPAAPQKRSAAQLCHFWHSIALQHIISQASCIQQIRNPSAVAFDLLSQLPVAMYSCTEALGCATSTRQKFEPKPQLRNLPLIVL